MDKQLAEILRQAALFPKKDFFSYSMLVGRIVDLPLTHKEHESAVKRLAEIMEV